MLKKTVTISRLGHFEAAMQMPDRMHDLVTAYFMVIDSHNNEVRSGADVVTVHSQLEFPTIPGLALHLGTSKNRITAIATSDKYDAKYPEDSLFYIRQACLVIEDESIKSALRGETNASFTKFLLSAYSGASERTIQEQVSTHNHIHIEFAPPSSVSEALAGQFAKEELLLEHKLESFVNKDLDAQGAVDTGIEVYDEDQNQNQKLDSIDVAWEEVPETLEEPIDLDDLI